MINENKFMVRYIVISVMLTVFIISCSNFVTAGFSNVTVTSLTEQDYSSIWLGISTGGYELITPIGQDYVFRIFVKNGMGNRSLHNLSISANNFTFQVNDIKPKIVEQIKPMEIIVFYVNATIPPDTKEGRYVLNMDVYSYEFPKGVFKLSSEIKVVKHINTLLYGTYAAIAVLLLVWLFIRKYKISKEDKGKKREPE